MQAFGKKFTNCFCTSQRLILGVMCSLSIFTAYTMRVSLSVGITEMVQRKTDRASNDTSQYCKIENLETFNSVQADYLLYDWNEDTQGLILGAFYWGYILTHIPGALLAEHLSGKHIIGSGMLLNAVLTCMFPFAIVYSNGNVVVAVLLRLIMGLGQGVMFPVCVAMMAQWIPYHEQSKYASITFAGGLLGSAFTTVVSGFIISETRDWTYIFYFFGVMGLLWNLLWQLLCYSFPRTHPCIKDHELEYLEEELHDHVSKIALDTPWRNMITSLPVWALVVGQLGHSWGYFVMVIDLPKYMSSVLRFNVKNNGLYSAMPYFCMWFSTISFGYIADCLIEKNILSLKMTRWVLSIIGHVGPAVFLVFASYVGCNKALAVMMFSIAMFMMGAFFSGMKVNALDLAPNFAGTITGIVNGVGVVSAMLVPSVVGVLAPNQTIEEWRVVFWITFVLLVLTNIFFLVFMSADEQSWNNRLKRRSSLVFGM